MDIAEVLHDQEIRAEAIVLLRTGKNPPRYIIELGKCLAAANKAAAGTPNDKGQFYKKVSRELHKQ